MEYGVALINLNEGKQVAIDKAWCQILRRVPSVAVTASGSAMLKDLGVPPMSFRASKLNACFVARVYDAEPNMLTSKILSHVTKGKRQGTTALKIRNTGPQMDIFLTMIEGEQSQRATKRKLLLWRLCCIPGRPQKCQGCTAYTKATRSHVIRCSGIEAKIKELCTSLISH